jgi:hypothetical protein
MTDEKRSAWLQKLDEECPYQVMLPRRQLTDDSSVMDFLLSSYVGKFDMYVEDQSPAYVRYCFESCVLALVVRPMTGSSELYAHAVKGSEIYSVK